MRRSERPRRPSLRPTPEYDSETFRPAGSVVANQPEMLLALSQAGTGIARLPEYQVAKDLRSGTLMRLFAQHQDEKEEPLSPSYTTRGAT